MMSWIRAPAHVEQHTATAWKEFQDIEKSGGALQALLNGSIRQRVTNQRLQDARDVGRGRRVLVGVTRFAHPTEDDSREPINIREVEYQLGRPHATASIDLADTETNPAISLSAAQGPFGSATSELAAGASLSAVSANLVKGKPSLHTEPLPHYRRAAEIESLVASVRGWARLNKQPVRAAITLIGEASASTRVGNKRP